MKMKRMENEKRKMKREDMESGKRGFTLIELLVVIGILVALIAVLLPVITAVIERARIARFGVDIIEIMNAATVLNEHTALLPSDSALNNTDDCTEIEFTNLITIAGLGDPTTLGWKGPYLERDKAVSPWRSIYQICDDGNGDGNFSATPCGAVFSAGTTSVGYVIGLTLQTLSPQSRRQAIIEAIERTYDGILSSTAGKVRYDATNYDYVCIGVRVGQP